MEEEQQFCLRWNNFQANITSQFEALRDEEDFVDVTLACDGQRIKAHRVVLSACSPYFKELFRSNPCTHPILFMRDVEFQHLQSLVEFMYAGEVNVAQAHLSSFLRTAESLQIRGLTEAPQRHKQDPKLLADSSLTTTSVMQQSGVARARSSSPQESSQQNTSSPEDDDDEDLLSLSPASSPPPAKRAKEQEENPSVPPPSSNQPVTSPANQQVESAYKDDSAEIFEPKMEAPDYSSDGESKGGGFFGLDNSMDNPFSALHGSLDMFAGPSSQGFAGEASHDAAQVSEAAVLFNKGPRILPKPQGHENAVCDVTTLTSVTLGRRNSQGLVVLGEGVAITEEQLQYVNCCDHRKMTRCLATLLFNPEELASCSVTGQRWSGAGAQGSAPTKPALNPNKIKAIINCVKSRFPYVDDSKIKQVLAYKCKESSHSLRIKGLKTSR